MRTKPRWTTLIAAMSLAGLLAAACASSDEAASPTVFGPGPSVATAKTDPTDLSIAGAQDVDTSDVRTSLTIVDASAPQATDSPGTEPESTQPEFEPETRDPLISGVSMEVMDQPIRAGAQRMHFEVGPLDIETGQNNIALAKGQIPHPDVDGFITRIEPNLRMDDGSIPGVDVIHLHHGVWLNASARDRTSAGLPERFFAAGEEKTATVLPDGYGYPFATSDVWLLNYMIHNLWPERAQVWITYDIDFVPATAPEAASILPVHPIWMDVENGRSYPVFDVIQGTGADGTYTYPDQADQPYAGRATQNEWVVDHDQVLLATAGHLHPGGLHNDLWATRDGEKAHVFQSVADYFEPAGAVSWDVAMGATPPDWRVQVKAGDVLSTSATYDSERASWYESMGIMVVWAADVVQPGDVAPDPFETSVVLPGLLTHGHLAENDNHGGGVDPAYFDALTLPDAPAADPVVIGDFVYGQGDMLLGDPVPAVAAGTSITFYNLDDLTGNGLWHTITACKAPCNQATGIAYPLADGEVTFDSGQLGTGGPPTANRTTWSTPDDLDPGTYTYFCRIHPFMRGAFRITDTA